LGTDADTLTRTRDLVAADVVADKFLRDADATVRQDRAGLEAARQRLLVFGLTDADIAEIEAQQGRQRMAYAIASPKSGVVTEKNVAQGELADPSANLFTIADLSKMWVWGDVYERDWRRVKPGQRMRVIVASRPDEPRDCVVEWVSPVLDGASRSVRIRGSLDNRDGRLLADMYCTILLAVDEDGGDSVVVPADAVVHERSAAFVFVESGRDKSGAKYRRRGVDVASADSGTGFGGSEDGGRSAGDAPAAVDAVDGGPRRAERVRILSGIAPGETLVVSGALLLESEIERRGRDAEDS
jgi:multidrug efflux pump subunit AcrA (membrane-fusion protein)